MAAPPKAVAFDIIGTVFLLEPLRAKLASAGLPESALDAWFPASLRDFFALGATDTFQPLREVLGANLDTLATRHRTGLSSARKTELLDSFAALPPHADAGEAFRRVKAAGARILAVSNGAGASTEKLLAGAGLDQYVDAIVSVDEVGRPKPRREVYLHAAKIAGTNPPELALVATHPWDIHGAKCAGLMTGFVARGFSFPPIFSAPDATGQELADVAAELFPFHAKA